AEALSATVIFPFVPQFVRDTGITGGNERKTGYWAGVLESVFFVAEFLSVYLWGRASDRFGRRPVLLLGPLGLAFALIGFGWSKNFGSLVVFRCAQGVFNGNIGNPHILHIPIIGGLLSNPEERWPDSFGKLQILRENPYLLPCATVGLLSLSFFFLGLVALKESSPMILAGRKREILRISASTDPTLTTNLVADTPTGTYGAITVTDVSTESDEAAPLVDEELPTMRELLVPRLVVPLLNYGFFCFSQTAFQVLFPLMYSTSIENGGLGFSPYQIGITRGIWGITNTFCQLFVAARIIRRIGAKRIYIFAFANFTICIGAYPLLNFLARRANKVDSIVWTIVIVLYQIWRFPWPSAQLYIVSSSPRPSALSSTNSLAQMVSTVVRALAPFIASALFALSLEWNLAGGYLVYILLLAVVAAGICCSLLLSSDPKSNHPPA
ncbi:major facilitator superfamily domain-containing protein, partial [Mycena rosella]